MLALNLKKQLKSRYKRNFTASAKYWLWESIEMLVNINNRRAFYWNLLWVFRVQKVPDKSKR